MAAEVGKRWGENEKGSGDGEKMGREVVRVTAWLLN